MSESSKWPKICYCLIREAQREVLSKDSTLVLSSTILAVSVITILTVLPISEECVAYHIIFVDGQTFSV
jgi:hypothetical protein